MLTEDVLSTISGSTLFYPCSGTDLLVPVRIFSPFVTNFWFVDRSYFSPGSQDFRRGSAFDAPADMAAPVLQNDRHYRLLEMTPRGPVSWDPSDPEIDPCVLSERYQHIPSGEYICIRRRRGYGFSAFRTENMHPLGVFFYRGDSAGEGGSGNLWLARDHLDEVCDKLIDGGLIVTDGCNHGHPHGHQYEELWKFEQDPGDARDIVKSAKPFTDRRKRSFTCIGCAGRRYGPALIWQVRKPG